MSKLIAQFDVELAGSLILEGPQNDNSYNYKTRIKDFDVHLALVIPELYALIKDTVTFPMFINKLQVTVERDETGDSVQGDALIEDRKQSSLPNSYFSERLPAYQEVARIAVNRVIRYFKYRLQNPFLSEIDVYEQSIQNPKWFNGNGQQLNYHVVNIIVPEEAVEKLGIKRLDLQRQNELENALNSDFEVELYEEIISDAQNAILSGNFRRAVLEMAIAVEVFVKKKYFGGDTISGFTIEYLEDKNRLNIKVIELIDGVAKQVFGSSFREHNKKAFDNIDFLFRSRNKVAHRGAIFYKDDSGQTHAVDQLTLEIWWESMTLLHDWISSIGQKI